MGPGPDAGSLIHPGCPADGFARTLAAAWLDAPFRSGRAVRLRRVCRDALAIPCDDQHESQRDPYDNAACESFMKTLKYEEVYRNEYRYLPEARASIGQFLEQVYNQKRLHYALGYVPPAEFEQQGGGA